MENEKLIHPFKPVVFEDSEILILGTFPSIKSFENNFYYSHPRNQFWNILSIIFNDKKPENIREKIEFLKRHKIALWDAVCECVRKDGNSRDDNLEIIKPCNIENLLKTYKNIQKVAVTSRTAENVIKKHFKNSQFSILNSPLYLPSPSPLNARLKPDQKAEIWKKLLELT
ncbi:DNA-deoxyinosine glycosylase [Nautilia sp. PV-1]|uniref:DNA-deoxyinosine glycosylase n=1 Tax=Nautilia sp. PV-1 TaxID=2579250 RepID=UPI000FD7AFA5|nr:DNA-deoxyinosine glycosylase [Nautilia sp. PV-1]AZV46824.1 DNA-deoxyinosine glycosylase [Nautilia sp. PV-1]